MKSDFGLRVKKPIKININRMRFILFATGIVFLAVGIFRGEMDIVLRKAVNICLECIGIG